MFCCSCLTLDAMDNERIREICLALPHARETLNWGQVLVYWVGDREIGGINRVVNLCEQRAFLHDRAVVNRLAVPVRAK